MNGSESICTPWLFSSRYLPRSLSAASIKDEWIELFYLALSCSISRIAHNYRQWMCGLSSICSDHWKALWKPSTLVKVRSINLSAIVYSHHDGEKISLGISHCDIVDESSLACKRRSILPNLGADITTRFRCLVISTSSNCFYNHLNTRS